jgi:N-hydroxyarylamine O-acetyltransferase
VDGTALDIGLRDAYLGRLGLEAEPPSVEALQRLHRRQVERIPYETLWIQAGERWGIDPLDAVARIALHGRGGYCYHLNGAFSELLRSLGYAATRHVGGVHGPDGPGVDSAGNLVVVTVSGLASDENPGGVWYIDAGLGDALHEALPLVAGVYEQPPFRLVLEERDRLGDEWHLTHDPSGGFVGMDWSATAVEMQHFATKHEWLSTSPDSGFVRVPMAEHRDATGVDVIRGLILSRVGEGATSYEPLLHRDEWFGCLADVFGLRFDTTAPESLDRLWDSAVDAHRAWEDARGT